MTWLHCLAAQPNPKERDIALVLDRRVMPKSIQDRDKAVWPGDAAASRSALAALVARELPALRRQEERLRVNYEQPARAEAKERALARLACNPQEVALLRAQRGHEQAYQRASAMLLKARKALAAERPRPGGTSGVEESALIPTPVALDAPVRRAAGNDDPWIIGANSNKTAEGKTRPDNLPCRPPTNQATRPGPIDRPQEPSA
jgi:hypothetical protein